ncbi:MULTISPECIES: LacI family DNA-binding transcriptional regulator [unclassified Rathayibacter]|uniref:LacI family DNA-binding transcriptional regulator n=1 Tax=unclassified Rathayibacter TaxID=2609250 RepID=UPI0006F6DB04|nr:MULTISPECIES: LacI family DNA-binding transcriptional regulator [unclassified Rathayibacter]KQQ03803.1 hypothetical protein ASF42_10080 [Rathayibacter sp. Leaf294]KQS12260.1 hypothetical protein ASG06_10080 [Rathayibacter sp. Leaf185]
MQQIAQLAGVSVTTVSHVLSGKRPVNPRTAERILAIIRQSGYVPDSAARTLQSGRSRLLAVAVPDITTSYFSRIAKGVELVAATVDYGVILCSTSIGGQRSRRYLDLLRNRTVEGLVYVAGDSPVDTEELRPFAADYPLVLADEELPSLEDVTVVTSDNRHGGRLAGEHLAALGHERVLIIAGPRTQVSTRDRAAGLRESFPDALMLNGDFSTESGAALADEALRSGTPFTAIAAGNDELAIGAIGRLRAAGIDVPGDVSVIGFDDIEAASLIGLTSISQPAVAIGSRAARLLLDALVDPSVARVRESMPVELVVRASTARVRVVARA